MDKPHKPAHTEGKLNEIHWSVLGFFERGLLNTTPFAIHCLQLHYK